MGGRKGGRHEGREGGRGESEREGEGEGGACTRGTSGKQAAGLRYELRCNRDEVNLVSQAPGCLDGRNVGVDPGIDAELRDFRKAAIAKANQNRVGGATPTARAARAVPWQGKHGGHRVWLQRRFHEVGP